MPKEKYFCFIDESGNPAFDRYQNNEKYLIFGASIIKETDCASIKEALKACKGDMGKSVLHFNKIHNHFEKKYVLKKISDECRFISFCTISNKKTLLKSGKEYDPSKYTNFYHKNLLYLFERISSFMKNEDIEKEDITFYVEENNAFVLKQFKNFIEAIRTRNHPSFLNNISLTKIYSHKKEGTDLFFLADMVASSLYQIVHGQLIHGQQIIETCYFNILLSHIYNRNGQYVKNGIKFIHSLQDLELSPEASSYFSDIEKNSEGE